MNRKFCSSWRLSIEASIEEVKQNVTEKCGAEDGDKTTFETHIGVFPLPGLLCQKKSATFQPFAPPQVGSFTMKHP